MIQPTAWSAGFEIRFESLFDAGRALTFPCDADGQVDFEGLSERARLNYERAQALVGREFATPDVRPSDHALQ
jgi:hypothetical protein